MDALLDSTNEKILMIIEKVERLQIDKRILKDEMEVLKFREEGKKRFVDYDLFK
jgi:predicted PP-loop superfamily ATPase